MTDQTDITVSAEAVALAVNAANSVRVANGEPAIAGLEDFREDAEPGVPHNCLLAKAFNFDFSINGFVSEGEPPSVPSYLHGVWLAAIGLDQAERAQRLADALGTGILPTYTADPRFLVEMDIQDAWGVMVILPPQVAAIATAFDAGWRP